MTNNQKHLSGPKWLIGLVIAFFLVCAGGLVYLYQNSSGGLFPGLVTAVPIPLSTGATGSFTSTGQAVASSVGKGVEYNMAVNISAGQEMPQTFIPLPLATGLPLDAGQIEQILSRLPTLQPASQLDFNLPQDVLPPPRPGQIVKENFPPLDTSPTPQVSAAGPLQVLRFAPEGEIPIAPFVSITFNQPMVPIGTLADLAARDVPVRIEPALPGTWRWLGTKTLTFEYDSALIDRLPKATEYHVSVLAGIKSISGVMLDKDVTWSFTTPPAKAVSMFPSSSPQPLAPLFFITFDQRINPAEVLKTIRVQAGSLSANLVLASDAEIQKDQQASELVKSAQPGRWLAFRAPEPFPTGTDIMITIGPGTPSAEGPLLTTQAQSYSFSTYAALRIDEYRCAWYGDTCPPLSPFEIRFNNAIDLASFREDMLHVEPPIPGVNANIYGNTMQIQGQTKGQTNYTVTISGEIKDVFGQTLGKDARLTFKVGKAESVLVGPGQTFLTIDPQAVKPVFSVYAINYNKLRTRVYAVQPTDWHAFKQYLQNWQGTDMPPVMPGTLLVDETINPNLPADTLTQVDIDLAKYLKGKFGHFIVIVEPPAGLFESDNAKWQRFSQTVISWVQVTQIGLDAVSDYSQMLAWASSLKDGSPLSSVSIQPGDGSRQYTTGADGTVRFDLPTSATYLLARQGDDQAILPHSNYVWGDDPWSSYPPTDSLRWYTFDDRKMYRPGEEVHIKGWLRRIGGRQDGDVGLPDGVGQVTYQITDATYNAIGNGTANVNTLGGFDFIIKIPQTVNLGSAQIQLNATGNFGGLDGTSWVHSFEVQEFRRPEFEVTARNETTGPYYAGGSATLAVDAKYYAGGALPNADVTWNVTSTPGNYAPPNWPDFIFGTWKPWWFMADFGYPPNGNPGTTETFTGKTDASGTHYLKLDFNQQGDPDQNPHPASVSAEATVMDVNRQAWTSSTSLLVHPADVYIGLRSDRYFVELGQPLNLNFIVTDLDGKPVAGRPVQLTAVRMEWKFRDGSWTEDEVDPQICSKTSTNQPQTCKFETPVGGSYQITASVTDDQGRKNQSRITRWVSGGQLRPSRKVEQEQVTLIPDKQTYQPGDTAQILVQSPFSPAEGLLTISRSGIISTTRFSIENGSTTLSVPIVEKYIPNLNIQVDLVGSAQRTDDQGQVLKNVPPRPAYASGQLNLSIPPLQRTLNVAVTPDSSKLEPGGETTLTVVVKDASGQPVADAELAVVVVDEAILALTNYQLTDPLSVFYSGRAPLVENVYGRASIVLLDPLALARDASQQKAVNDSFAGAVPAAAPAATMSSAAEARGGGGQAAQAPIRIRSDFNPLAAFAPSVHTGLDGTARVPVKLPDNLTRYRVMVVAVDVPGTKFGVGESNLTARLPLMVRPSAPRFLNFGDKFELPVVLQNQTDQPLDVNVAVRASNLELITAGLLVTVPANDRVEVRFPAGTIQAGTARIQIAAVSGTYADAATVEMPVYTPATTEAFATYGVIDNPGALSQPVQYPTGVFPQYGGLEISTSSTALQSLTDAVLYLVAYPYEGSEQLASRILAVASLKDVLTAFKADGLPSPTEMESAVNRDIERLQGLQNPDGGFPYWRRGFESSPFNSIHVAHAIYRAGQKGFSVPVDMQQSALNYLRNIESYYPAWYGTQTRRTLSSYALYVRNLMNDRDAPKAHSLLKEAGLDGLSLDAIGWLWPLVEDPAQLESLRRYVTNHAVETAGAANFTTSYDDQNYLLLGSNRRTDAILLDSLIADNPQSDLIPKLVAGLMAHRTKGHWGNTQENVFVLIALDRYFNTFESQTPDFVARIWLGNTYAGSSEFRGRSTDLHETNIPMTYVLSETAAGGGTQSLILEKDGAGRLYYRLGLRYAPTDLNLPALDMGFVVQRRYEALDDPQDVSQDSAGVWHIRAGARVRVHLTMVADTRRYHVALVDPLPAGLEIVNPALAVSGSSPQDPSSSSSRYGWWWWGTWYEHQNMRDERAEAFTSLLWEGVYEYTYIARATTPGTFIVPPAKAEEMYSPEVFGRSASDQVIIQ